MNKFIAVSILITVMGVGVGFFAKSVYADYQRAQLAGKVRGELDNPSFYIFWDDVEKVNCYVAESGSGISMKCFKK